MKNAKLKNVAIFGSLSLFLCSTVIASQLPKTSENSVREETIGPAMRPFTEKPKKYPDHTSKKEKNKDQGNSPS